MAWHVSAISCSAGGVLSDGYTESGDPRGFAQVLMWVLLSCRAHAEDPPRAWMEPDPADKPHRRRCACVQLALYFVSMTPRSTR